MNRRQGMAGGGGSAEFGNGSLSRVAVCWTGSDSDGARHGPCSCITITLLQLQAIQTLAPLTAIVLGTIYTSLQQAARTGEIAVTDRLLFFSLYARDMNFASLVRGLPPMVAIAGAC